MLKKENRITKKKDFDKVFETNKGKYTINLGIKYIENNLDFFRLGVIVGIKVSKMTVKRNKIKRIIREIFKSNIDKIKTNIDIVVITLPSIKTKKYIDIENDVVFLLKKLNLFK